VLIPNGLAWGSAEARGARCSGSLYSSIYHLVLRHSNNICVEGRVACVAADLKASCFGRRQQWCMLCIFVVGSKHCRKTVVTGGLAGDGICAWDGAAGALAVVELVKGGLEIGWREIGPAFGEEDELG